MTDIQTCESSEYNRKMRLSTNKICLLAVVGLVLVGVAAAATTKTQEIESHEEQHKLPALFDFDNYKKMFSKSYTSLLEELERKRLYFARAFSAFVTGAKYKFRLLSHWQAVNHMSDWSEAEFQRTLNKAAMEEARAKAAAAGTLDELEGRAGSEDDKTQLPEFIAGKEENLDAQVEQIVEGQEFRELRDALAADDAGAGGRVKRSVETVKLREFSLDQLIADPSRINQLERREKSERASARVKSNNPYYKPIELPSFGFWGTKQEDVKWVSVAKHDERSLVAQFADTANSLFGINEFLPNRLQVSAFKPQEVAPEQVVAGGPLPDEMFVDLRDSKCIFIVRNQNECGSCYAFAAITIMEFLYCKKTNRLTAFSEQYMVDCGKTHSEKFIAHSVWKKMDGCEGAFQEGVAKFIHNFGLELRKNYPYRGVEGQCPYKKDDDLKRAGYIRAEINNVAKIHISDWHVALEHAPLYVVLAAGKDFPHYGGGVYDGSGCKWPGSHVTVLVGHGRQDGQEFWLIRNSYSGLWGENGYMKLSKKNAHKCVPSKEALAFGTSDGINYEFEPTIVAGKEEKKSENEKMLDEMVAFINKHQKQ